MKPTLLVLAAGMGSRYGSLKQMDGIGPNNEAILDYSVYDAIRSGFGKVVFVIRHSFENDFKQVFNKERFHNKIEVDYVFQELDALPQGFTVPSGREKPWGTNHAVLMAQDCINEPFAIINADDFYGYDAFMVIAAQLNKMQGAQKQYCMVGYHLQNTLSENGSVSRGVCQTNSQNLLVSIEEHTKIEEKEGHIHGVNASNSSVELDSNTIVSMNLFGFTPDYFSYSQTLFKEFLEKENANLKSEFYIPSVVNTLINTNEATMLVLSSHAKWFGVTYKEDKPDAIKQLQSLIEQGVYPAKLW